MADDEIPPGLPKWIDWIVTREPWSYACTFVAGAVVSSFVPFDWKTPTPWLWTAFAMTLAFWLSQVLATKWYRWRLGPPVLHLSPHNGGKASLALEHRGAPTVYRVDGRIVGMVDATAVNPAPQPFQCELLLMARTTAPEARVRDGYWALVVVASVVGGQLAIRRGKSNWNTVIPDSGAIVAYQVWSDPPLGANGQERRYRVVKNGGEIILTEE
jgi:hypothetical protein